MADILNNIEELVGKDEKLIDIWGRRNPRFEKKYEQSVLRIISDYGIGASENTGAKGKVLGAGYEPYIMAFSSACILKRNYLCLNRVKT